MSYVFLNIGPTAKSGFGEQVMRRHKGDYDFAFVPNWDGRGAAALNQDIVELTKGILQTYANGREPDEIYPGIDGSLGVTWDGGADNYVYAEFGPDDYMYLYYDIHTLGKWEMSSKTDDPDLLSRLKTSLHHSPQMMATVFVSTSSSYVLALP